MVFLMAEKYSLELIAVLALLEGFQRIAQSEDLKGLERMKKYT